MVRSKGEVIEMKGKESFEQHSGEEIWGLGDLSGLGGEGEGNTRLAVP